MERNSNKEFFQWLKDYKNISKERFNTMPTQSRKNLRNQFELVKLGIK